MHYHFCQCQCCILGLSPGQGTTSGVAQLVMPFVMNLRVSDSAHGFFSPHVIGHNTAPQTICALNVAACPQEILTEFVVLSL